MMRSGRRQVLGGMCACGGLALAGCTLSGDRSAPLPAGYQPVRGSREAALWKLMDDAEANIASSRFRLGEANVEAFVDDVTCRLATEHCPDIRVYVIRTPHFNASMAPNGMMQVWSGLLLRTQNEAQLAAVLGHELGHYLQRHSLQRLEDLMLKADVAAFLDMGLAVAGLGGMGDLSQELVMASVFAFSREQEREADEIGLELMAKAGYAPIEASRIWTQLVTEEKADPKAGTRSLLFATHPAPQERAQVLARKAATDYAGFTPTAKDRLRAELASVRAMLIEDQELLRQDQRTLALLDIMRENGNEDGPALYLRGEIYRHRDDPADLAMARDLYQQAVATGGAPDKTWRSLGFTEQKLGDHASARRAFARYLELVPNAPDREMILPYLDGEA